jgi:hypothetical protein
MIVEVVACSLISFHFRFFLLFLLSYIICMNLYCSILCLLNALLRDMSELVNSLFLVVIVVALKDVLSPPPC